MADEIKNIDENKVGELDCFEKLALCARVMADMMHKLAVGTDKIEEDLVKSAADRQLEEDKKREKYVKERAGDLTRPFFGNGYSCIIDADSKL